MVRKYFVSMVCGGFPWGICYWSTPKRCEIVARFKTREEAERRLRQLQEGDPDA